MAVGSAHLLGPVPQLLLATALLSYLFWGLARLQFGCRPGHLDNSYTVIIIISQSASSTICANSCKLGATSRVGGQ